MVAVLECSSDDAAGVSRNKPSKGAPKNPCFQTQGAAPGGDRVGAAALLAEAVDEVDEQVEVVVGGTDADGSIFPVSLCLPGDVWKCAQKVVLARLLELFEDVDGAGDGLADGPGGVHPGDVVFAFEGSAVNFPAVGSPVFVAFDLDAAAFDVFDLDVPHTAEESCRDVAGDLQVAGERGQARGQGV